MIDPELEAVLEFMPVIDLDDPVAARREFEKLIVAMRTPMPEEELLDIEDRRDPGLGGRSRGLRARLPAEGSRHGAGHRGARDPPDPRRGLHRRQRGGRARRRGPHGGSPRCGPGLGRVPPGTRAPVSRGTARLLRGPVLPPYRGACARRGPGADRARRVRARAAVWLPPPRCWPATGAVLRSASRCCTSPSSTTGSRRRRCRSSWTLRSGTGHWR